MNHLNSVLIEGFLTTDPKTTVDGQVFLHLKSWRFWKDEDLEYHKTESHISVQVLEKSKRRVLDLDLEEGHHVRIVGRLEAPTGKVAILAEHVEKVRDVRQTA